MGLRDGQRAAIDVSFLFGDDFRVVDLTDIELLAYFRLWGTAVKYRCHLLPAKFDHRHHARIAGLIKVHRNSCANMLRKCGENALLQLLQDGRILVVGVGVHHSWMIFKDGPNGENWQSKNGHPYEQEVGSRKKDEGRKEVGESAPPSPPSLPSLEIKSQFPEVIESLRSINAQGYRDLSGTPEFDKVLSAEKVRLGGLDRINREAQRFALYVEGQLQLGKEKRTKRSRPYKRFADWLAREKPGDSTHGTNGTNGEYAIDRARRELAESIAARRPEVGSLSGD